VISRRLRLSFLNAQAALEALPRVVDIMAEELNWNATRKQQEMIRTIRFLQSMGLPPSAVVPAPVRSPQDWYDWAFAKLEGPMMTKKAAIAAAGVSSSNGRAQFERGEVDSLREVFLERSRNPAGRLAKPAIRELLQGIPAYAGIRTKDFEYVLEETGLAKQKDIDVEEFVEVRNNAQRVVCVLFLTDGVGNQICAELKDVSFAPVSRAAVKKLRRAIPVEKSGGGV
jgi:glycerol-3-phosphate dehydrogenase